MRVKSVAAAESVANLLDGNVLVALTTPSHVHHDAAEAWFARQSMPFATCPITQGTLMRMMMHLGQMSTEQALAALHQVIAHPCHRFWPDAIGYAGLSWRGVIGHRQVTDAYLAGLARHFGGKLASFDKGLASLHSDVVELIEAP
jgi:toxin-antitoxin system PIN domain toxin